MEKENNNWFYKIFLKSWRPFVWLILIGFLVYGQTLFFDFTYFDDDILIINNQGFIRNMSNILQTFKEDVFISPFNIYYRPILTISLMVDAQLGQTAPFVYHLSNIIIHLIVSLLLFFLLLKLQYKKDLSFLFALLFAVHPVLSQAVSWIPGRNDSLLTLFILSSFIFFLKFNETLGRKKLIYCFLHLLFFCLALLTKETAIVLIPIIILFHVLITKKRLTNNNILLAVGWITISAVWLYLKSLAQIEPGFQSNLLLVKYLLANFPAVIQYIGKIFFPVNLSVQPIMQDTTFFYGILALVALLMMLILIKQRRNHYLYFGFLWFILFLLPALVRDPKVIPDFMEHRLYLPMVGFIIFLMEIIQTKSQTINKKMLLIAGLLIIFSFSSINFVHSKSFKNRLTFWENAAYDSPHSSFIHRNLGYIYQLENRMDEAEAEFKNSLLIRPNELLAHYYLGKIYLNKQLISEAREEFEKELINDPLLENARYELGMIYLKQGEILKAQEQFEKILLTNSNDYQARNNLGNIYLTRNLFSEAEREIKKALEIKPDYDGAYQNLGLLYYQQGKFIEAESAWEKALEINPQLLKVRENLIVLYLQQKNNKKAVFHYTEIKKLGGQVQPELQKILEK